MDREKKDGYLFSIFKASSLAADLLQEMQRDKAAIFFSVFLSLMRRSSNNTQKTRDIFYTFS